PNNGWKSYTVELTLNHCNIGPSCKVFVTYQTRYCEGTCDIYVEEWTQPDYSTCTLCPPSGTGISHEEVLAATIGYAIKNTPNWQCDVWPDSCENSIRVSTASCGELVYTGTWTHPITLIEYHRHLGWRACDDAYCCIAL